MLFESEWSGDVITAPVLVTDDPEDEMSTSPGDRMRSLIDLHLNQGGEALGRCDLARSLHQRRWISLLTSILGELRSRIHRRREMRRISAAWTMVDDRTLNDIGTSRLEVEYAMDTRHWG